MFDANAMPVLCQFASPELRSTGYGVFNMAGSIVGGIMTAMAGAFRDRFGLSAMLQAAALCALLSALALLRLPMPPTSEAAPAAALAAETGPHR
jgi:sugar phosphate permease